MNLFTIVLAVILILVLVGGGIIYYRQANSTDNTVVVTDFNSCAAAGNPIQESYPRRCTANGITYTEDIGNENDKSDLILVTEPRPNAEIASPITVTGEARGKWYFEASFPVRVYDANNNLLGTGIAQAKSDWMTEDFVPFETSVTFTKSATQTGTLVLEKDNPSGLPENADELRIPVKFKEVASGSGSNNTQTVLVYFQPKDVGTDCSKVVSRERKIAQTQAVGRAALEELLKGPTAEEKQLGISSSLPTGVTLSTLRIENGTATADFSAALSQGVAGSCRVTAIRAQIEKTLKQFPTVSKITISVNGKTDDVLQP